MLFFSVASTTTTTTASPTPKQTALWIARTYDSVSPENILVLDRKFNDRAGEFDSSTYQFIAKTTGYFYLGMSTGIKSAQTVSVSLRGAFPQVTLLRQYTRPFTTAVKEMISRDTTAYINQGEIVNLRSNNQGVSSAFPQSQCALYIYELDDVAEMSSLFHVSSSVRQSTLGVINFNQIQMSPTSTAFDIGTQSFTCKSTGTYVFHISSGLVASVGLRLYLKGTARNYALARESTNHNGVDIISRTVIAQCNAGSRVTLELQAGETYSDSTDFELSLIGYRYAPKAAADTAFAGYRSMSWQGAAGATLAFDTVGRSDNFDGTRFFVSIAGYYYVYYGAIIPQNQYAQLSLVRTRQSILIELAAVTSDTTANNGYDTIGRGVVVQLEAGDTLHIRTQNAVSLYADPLGYQISFVGMMLYYN